MINENGLKERLRVIASENATTVNKIWKQLLLERFLARLSTSPHQNKFIFKGGLLLANYIKINRETVDLDFSLTKIKSETKNIEEAISEVATTDIHDGFYFKWDSIDELNQPHMNYNGFRILLNSGFGNMTDKIQIDIGVGDAVVPVESQFYPFEYKGKPIFMGEISLQVYPPEYIFSEKLQSIISKNTLNSRMKDFHDLILMIREPNFLNSEKLAGAIQITFKRRGTPITTPIQIDINSANNLQQYWSNHLRGLGGFRKNLNFPDHISEIIAEINNHMAAIQTL